MFFLPYQHRWITDSSRIKIIEKSRQIGMSWTAAYAIVRRQSLAPNRLDAWVSSRDELQATLFLDDCKAFARILNLAASDIGHSLLPPDHRHSAHSLLLDNKTRIHSLSSNPDAQAGKRGPRLLDEFALHPDPRRLYAVAYPGITWGRQLEIISTHRGSHNFFNRLVTEITEHGNPKQISHHRVTLQDALDQGLLHKLKAKLPHDDPRQDMDEAAYFNFIKNSCADTESFLQEYMCVPADDASAFLPCDLIAACEYPESEPWQWQLHPQRSEISTTTHKPLTSADSLYLGVDVGRARDLSVFWLLHLGDDAILRTRILRVFENTPFSQQEQTLYRLLDLPQLRRACIDATGLGRQFAERAAERYGPHRVEAVHFTAAAKEQLAYPLRHTFEEQALRIPPDKHIRADLRSIKRTTTASGHTRFAADRGPAGHADRFWALALSIHAARTPAYPQHHYEPLPRYSHTPQPLNL